MGLLLSRLNRINIILMKNTRLTRGAGPALAWFQNTPETLIRNIQNYHWWVILSSVVAAPIQNQKKLDPLLRNIFENILVKKNLGIFKFFDDDFFLRNFLEFQNFRNRKIFKISSSKKKILTWSRELIVLPLQLESWQDMPRTGLGG